MLGAMKAATDLAVPKLYRLDSLFQHHGLLQREIVVESLDLRSSDEEDDERVGTVPFVGAKLDGSYHLVSL